MVSSELLNLAYYGSRDQGPCHKQSQANGIKLKFKPICLSLIGWNCLQGHFYVA